jgi:hypothetical protein
MLYVIFYVFVGWLLHFVSLDSFFNHILHFSELQYYLVWFIFGVLVGIKRIFY